MFCSNCGRNIDVKALFCPGCGNRVVSNVVHPQRDASFNRNLGTPPIPPPFAASNVPPMAYGYASMPAAPVARRGGVVKKLLAVGVFAIFVTIAAVFVLGLWGGRADCPVLVQRVSAEGIAENVRCGNRVVWRGTRCEMHTCITRGCTNPPFLTEIQIMTGSRGWCPSCRIRHIRYGPW